jgi:hypothetical protein
MDWDMERGRDRDADRDASRDANRNTVRDVDVRDIYGDTNRDRHRREHC